MKCDTHTAYHRADKHGRAHTFKRTYTFTHTRARTHTHPSHVIYVPPPPSPSTTLHALTHTDTQDTHTHSHLHTHWNTHARTHTHFLSLSPLPPFSSPLSPPLFSFSPLSPNPLSPVTPNPFIPLLPPPPPRPPTLLSLLPNPPPFPLTPPFLSPLPLSHYGVVLPTNRGDVVMVDDGFECGCKYSVVLDTALHSSEHVLGARRVGGRLCETSIVLLHAVPDRFWWQTVKRASCCYMLSQTGFGGRLWNEHRAVTCCPRQVLVADSVKRASCCYMLSQTGFGGRLWNEHRAVTCCPRHVLVADCETSIVLLHAVPDILLDMMCGW